MSVNDLTNTTWLFNSSISYMSRNTGYPLDFTDAGGNTWHKMTIRTDGIRYAYDDSSYTTVNNNGSWVNNNYKTIHITGGTSVNVDALISWLESNATQQSDPPVVQTIGKIFAGTKKVKKIYIGTKKVKKVYVGTKLSYEDNN